MVSKHKINVSIRAARKFAQSKKIDPGKTDTLNRKIKAQREHLKYYMTHNKAGQSVPKVFPSERMFVTSTVGGLCNYDEWLDRFKTQQVLHAHWKDDEREQ